MFSKILVPLDGSEIAERALAPALALANKPGAHLTFLRVPLVPTGWDRGIEGTDPYIEAWAEQRYGMERKLAQDYLAKVKQQSLRDDVEVETKIMEGDVATVILQAAAEHDLVVMSTHGYSGLTKWMMGSVAEKVLTSASCPALVIRSPQPVRKILIPLDGSSLSETALAPGLELALRLEAEVVLLRIVPEVSVFEQAELATAGDTNIGSRLQEGFMAEGESYLDGLVTTPPESGFTIAREALIAPSPAERILDYSERHGIDLIVMATHGRTGLSKWVYGSVTEKVLRHTHCSMLVVRPSRQHLN